MRPVGEQRYIKQPLLLLLLLKNNFQQFCSNSCQWGVKMKHRIFQAQFYDSRIDFIDLYSPSSEFQQLITT